MKNTFKIVILLFISLQLIGQNIHSSQNYFHPMLSEPTATGDIKNGNIRLGTSFRNQAFTVTPNSYRTYFAYVDFKFESIKINDDNIGLGLIIINDQAGNGKLTNNKIGLNLAYHFHFDSFLSGISIGSRLGFVSRYFGNFNGLKFEEDLVGNGFSENVKNAKNNYTDLGFGTVFRFKLNFESELKLGVGINSIALGKTKDKEILAYGKQYTFFVKADYPIYENIRLLPSVYYIQSSENKNLQIQSLILYHMDISTLKIGIGYRYKDAIQALLGIKIKSLDIGLAYDINISELNSASGLASGLELGFKYIFTPGTLKKNIKRYYSDMISNRTGTIVKLEKTKLKKVESDDIARKEKPQKVIVKREQTIKLNNILFDFDDDKILPEAENDLRRLLSLLIKYKDMVIELSSHTDSQGDEEYNMALSQRRAEMTKNWLIERGVKPKQIIAKGYGESRLLNHCKDNVDCSEEEHRVNRRTEFKIIAGPTTVIW